jgi:Fe-S cluster assembly ATP-binding protein
MEKQQTILTLSSVSVAVEDKAIVSDFSLSLEAGSVHAIMGPNGSGKSSLAHALMGHPSYEITGGSVTLEGESLLECAADERAKKGLFLAFQYPYEIEGLALRDFLRSAYNARFAGTEKQIGIKAFRALFDEWCGRLGIDPSYGDRGVNVGFSGGEKKQVEMLQLALLQPKVAILDEIDSGLDVDALRRVCAALQEVRSAHPEMAVMMITHYQRILQYVKPDFVHVMRDGKLVRSGDASLAEVIEHEGYQN